MAKTEIINERVIGSDGRIHYFYGGELVRCKDCIHKPLDNGRGWPDNIESLDRVCPFLRDDDDYLDELPPSDDFFCAYGERKDNDRSAD